MEFTRNFLINRIDDLKTYLDNAIDAVEAELKIEAPVKSANRRYEHTTPPDRGVAAN